MLSYTCILYYAWLERYAACSVYVMLSFCTHKHQFPDFFLTVLAAKHAPTAQEYAKKGCPTSARGELWCQIMGIEVTDVVSLCRGKVNFADNVPNT